MPGDESQAICLHCVLELLATTAFDKCLPAADVQALSGTLRNLTNDTIPLPKLTVPLFQQTLALYNQSSNIIAG